MKLSIIIVLYNEFKIVQNCLAAIYSQKIAGMEVLLIDNSDREGVGEVLKKFPDIRYTKNKTNLGFAKAVNVGFAKARGEYKLVLTPDTKLLPGTLKKTVDYMDAHPQTGLLGCRFYSYPRMLHECSFHTFPNLVSHAYEYNTIFYKLWNYFTGNKHPLMYSLKDHDKELHPAHMIGVYMMLRKKAGDEVGYLDNQFHMYREETDLCKRLRNKCWDIAYIPVGGIVHFGGAEWKDFTITQCYEQYMRSTYLFFKKHYGKPYMIAAYFIGFLSSIMCIPVLFITKTIRELQNKQSQSKAILPAWIRILKWHVREFGKIIS